MKTLGTLLTVWAVLGGIAVILLLIDRLDRAVQQRRGIAPLLNGRRPTGVVGKAGMALLALGVLVLLLGQGAGSVPSGMADGCAGSMRC